jgi:hypothetical protein
VNKFAFRRVDVALVRELAQGVRHACRVRWGSDRQTEIACDLVPVLNPTPMPCAMVRIARRSIESSPYCSNFHRERR